MTLFWYLHCNTIEADAFASTHLLLPISIIYWKFSSFQFLHPPIHPPFYSFARHSTHPPTHSIQLVNAFLPPSRCSYHIIALTIYPYILHRKCTNIFLFETKAKSEDFMRLLWSLRSCDRSEYKDKSGECDRIYQEHSAAVRAPILGKIHVN
ncbi:hypothetical protein C8R48DRAFT_284752 [Suillus tomentosus]|nr:hypothetical protein C8R48DRAFT_284752 [Suillus tomentosus]